MAEGDRAELSDPRPTGKRFVFNPLWIVDGLAVLGAGAYGWAVSGAADPSLSVLLAPARELGLLAIASAIVVNGLAWTLRHRDGRNDARRELMRRLAGLNDALLDLRKSLSRDHTRRFLERRTEFAVGGRLAARWLGAEELRLTHEGEDFCAGMTQALADIVHRRAEAVALADRLRRELDRAARRAELELHDADNLIHLVEDSVRVMDEGLYAEWNADHFGRLGANRSAFAREIARYKSTLADRIELHGLELFDRLVGHVERKVETLDLIARWEQTYRRLENRLAGMKSAPVLAVSNPLAPTRPRLSERFSTPLPDEAIDTDFPRARRLPAAND